MVPIEKEKRTKTVTENNIGDSNRSGLLHSIRKLWAVMVLVCDINRFSWPLPVGLECELLG